MCSVNELSRRTCGADKRTNNCNSIFHFATRRRDVYVRVDCVIVSPSPPPQPPAPPPVCDLAACDNGGKCGVCLEALEENSDRCPRQTVLTTANCNSGRKLDVGEMCVVGLQESQCGASRSVNNCRFLLVTYDVYKRVDCRVIFPPPSPPPPVTRVLSSFFDYLAASFEDLASLPGLGPGFSIVHSVLTSIAGFFDTLDNFFGFFSGV